ncbi:hypothetical protein [Lysinibacillus fusiformis]|uniref:hypothetical protein n=1 Tax=Lysinibacillus fusiformis TaxID=28031 RepID=UPI003D04CAA6
MGFWSELKADMKAQKEEIKASQKEMSEKFKPFGYLKFEYLGGHRGLKGKEIRIAKGKETNELYIETLEVKLLDYQWGEKSMRSAGKAATGAVIGTVLTGGLGGLAVGAAIGGKKKDNSTLTLAFEENGQNYNIMLRCDEKQFKKFSATLL